MQDGSQRRRQNEWVPGGQCVLEASESFLLFFCLDRAAKQWALALTRPGELFNIAEVKLVAEMQVGLGKSILSGLGFARG